VDKTLTKNDKFKFLSYNCAITNKQNNMHELMKSTLLISNEAINGSYDYTPLEIDLMIHIINAAVKETDQNKKCHLRFTYGQLMDDAQGNDYNQLRSAFLSLLKKPYEIYYKETGQYFAANLITAVTINKNSGFILVDLHPKILQLITDIKKNYTSFETRSVLSLKSKYAKRLYLMCCQFKNTGVKYTVLGAIR